MISQSVVDGADIFVLDNIDKLESDLRTPAVNIARLVVEGGDYPDPQALSTDELIRWVVKPVLSQFKNISRHVDVGGRIAFAENVHDTVVALLERGDEQGVGVLKDTMSAALRQSCANMDDSFRQDIDCVCAVASKYADVFPEGRCSFDELYDAVKKGYLQPNNEYEYLFPELKETLFGVYVDLTYGIRDEINSHGGYIDDEGYMTLNGAEHFCYCVVEAILSTSSAFVVDVASTSYSKTHHMDKDTILFTYPPYCKDIDDLADNNGYTPPAKDDTRTYLRRRLFDLRCEDVVSFFNDIVSEPSAQQSLAVNIQRATNHFLH